MKFRFDLIALVFAAILGCGGAEFTAQDAGGSSGGTAGAGGVGTGGTGGQPADAASHDAPTTCTSGTTTFHMSAAGSSSGYCVGSNCSNVWVTVTSKDGQSINIAPQCLTTCDACNPIGCAASCAAPQPMKPEGESLTWDGSYWVQSTCGAQVACQARQCAAPGGYVAKMCAYRSISDAGLTGFCAASPTPTCVDVEFDYPSATVVEGVLQ